MSKRKRNHSKPTASLNIEWLKHRTGYPSPEEREAIIKMRRELASELLIMMLSKVKPESARGQVFYKKYGREEVEHAIEKMETSLELPSFVGDDARSYRDYRQRYSRFGAGLKFYSAKELDDLYKKYGEEFNGDEETETGKLLIVGWQEWDDITPPAIPTRPVDFSAPTPAAYPAPINELLEWGDDLHKSHDFSDEKEWENWKKHIPALTRMALDPGLLNGWVSETASWAPWHAIHALGNLRAWESAPALASLADLENDWLSDHLPHIWADMGTEVETSLWMILENTSASTKQRGLAAQSLRMLTEENEPIETRVIAGFEKILKNEKTFDPSLNAYLLYYLQEMEAIDEVRETAEIAFEQGRIDQDIFTPEDLDDDDNGYDFDDDGYEEDNFGEGNYGIEDE